MNKFCKEIIYFQKQSRCDRREWGILIWIVGTTYKEGHAQLQSTLRPFKVFLSTAFPVTHIQCKMHHVYWLCTFTTELWNKRVAIVIFSIEDQPALSSSWTAVRIGRMNEWMNGLLLWWGLSICRGECLSVCLVERCSVCCLNKWLLPLLLLPQSNAPRAIYNIQFMAHYHIFHELLLGGWSVESRKSAKRVSSTREIFGVERNLLTRSSIVCWHSSEMSAWSQLLILCTRDGHFHFIFVKRDSKPYF